MPRPWTVLPHDPIQKAEGNLWLVQGDVPGMGLRRWMAVVRRPSGALLVHNGIAMEDAAMKEIEAWGEPRTLVVPNGWHRLDAHAYKDRYPKMRVLCPPAVDARVRKAVAVDGHYDAFDTGPDARYELLEGEKIGEGVLVVTSEGGHVTLVFCDTLFNLRKGDWFTRLTGSAGGPKVTPMFRMYGVSDRKKLAAHLRRLAEIPGLHRVVPGHGEVLEGADAIEGLRAAAAKLA